MTAAEPTSGPIWVQTLLSAVAVLGGAGGITAVVTVLTQRRKLKADAADVLTDTALTLIDPLRARVADLEAETARARQQAIAANNEISELRVAVQEMTVIIRRWRAAILAPNVTVEELRQIVATSDPWHTGDQWT
ncbi:hypothetical protein GCM10027290_07450 [Micromonospora sonneratiae]|uniref:Uncharacterized protein n=1 Tax=Micromonospora sonneratiae TaxID=1184706 RepID=A0ABW3YEH0_9ACTN